MLAWRALQSRRSRRVVGGVERAERVTGVGRAPLDVLPAYPSRAPKAGSRGDLQAGMRRPRPAPEMVDRSVEHLDLSGCGTVLDHPDDLVLGSEALGCVNLPRYHFADQRVALGERQAFIDRPEEGGVRQGRANGCLAV